MTEWIKVEDMLPSKSMVVKWKCKDGVEDIGFYYADKKVFGTIGMLSEKEITHWAHVHIQIKNKIKHSIMAVEIKHSAGDEVYWLSSQGFKKGWIKRIYYSEEKNGRKEHKYFLVHKQNTTEYMGDEVQPNLIFTSYKDMLEYYSNQYENNQP